MGVLAPLVLQAQPSLLECAFKATEGRTWSWLFTDVTDGAGNPIDLSSNTITAVCKVWDSLGGPEVVTLGFTGTIGAFTISKSAAQTAGLAGDTGPVGRVCVWGLTLTTPDESVQVWGPAESKLAILQET